MYMYAKMQEFTLDFGGIKASMIYIIATFNII